MTLHSVFLYFAVPQGCPNEPKSMANTHGKQMPETHFLPFKMVYLKSQVQRRGSTRRDNIWNKPSESKYTKRRMGISKLIYEKEK